MSSVRPLSSLQVAQMRPPWAPHDRPADGQSYPRSLRLVAREVQQFSVPQQEVWGRLQDGDDEVEPRARVRMPKVVA
jgi:hypothetical protein